jgi:hypothetical protein
MYVLTDQSVRLLIWLFSNQSATLQAVLVLFLHPVATDHILNRLTSYVGALTHGVGACHVELCMPHNDGLLISSIYNGETVNVNTTKRFSNEGYTVHTLMVNDQQLASMKKTVLLKSGRKDPFDAVGMYLAWLPFKIPRIQRGNGTFCSKYVTQVKILEKNIFLFRKNKAALNRFLTLFLGPIHRFYSLPT